MRINNSRGKLVAVFGPDGSGKSTIYSHLCELCKSEKIDLSHYHWRPGLLPYTKKKSGRDLGGAFTNPHYYEGRNILVSTVILCFIFLDFLLGYWLVIRPELKRGVSIYYERYYHDVLVDELRYNLCTPLFFRMLLSKFIFKPDHIVILSSSAEVIRARKQELTLEEILVQQKCILKVFKNSKNVVILDVEKNNAEKCAKSLLEIMKQSDE